MDNVTKSLQVVEKWNIKLAELNREIESISSQVESTKNEVTQAILNGADAEKAEEKFVRLENRLKSLQSAQQTGMQERDSAMRDLQIAERELAFAEYSDLLKKVDSETEKVLRLLLNIYESGRSLVEIVRKCRGMQSKWKFEQIGGNLSQGMVMAQIVKVAHDTLQSFEVTFPDFYKSTKMPGWAERLASFKIEEPF
jgi:hypothetical protein